MAGERPGRVPAAVMAGAALPIERVQRLGDLTHTRGGDTGRGGARGHVRPMPGDRALDVDLVDKPRVHRRTCRARIAA
jgi:hypothetical protein